MIVLEWRKFCNRVRDVLVDDEGLVVDLGQGRRHRVAVRSVPGAIELSAVVAKRAVVDGLNDVALSAWKRNRAASLAGFRIDARGRLVGEAWMPLAGLTKDEFLLYVRSLAAACDLFEFQLTGRDRE